MSKNLQKRVDFARSLEIAPSAITRALQPGKPLAPAAVGKLVDVSHPAAVAYIERWENRSPDAQQVARDGTDPLYAEAVQCCQENGRWSARVLREKMGMADPRARRLIKIIKAAGAHELPPPPDVEEPEPPPRGQAVVRDQKKQAPPVNPGGAGVAEASEVPDDIQAFGEMTLRELVSRFGTDVRFLDWLKAVEKLEVIEARRLKNAETSGRLVARDLVQSAIIDPFTSAHLRLISDGSKTIAAGASSKAQSGASLPEVEAYVSDIIGSFLKPVKSKVARGLRDV